MNLNDALAIHYALQGYMVANDDTSAPGYTQYVNRRGEWYIMKNAVSGNVTTYTWTKGSSGAAAAWTGRAALTYDAFDVIFKSN